MNSAIPVLAIDGPSGSGKGTIGQLCAHQLGWHYLDSGAIYRALAWVTIESGAQADDIDAVVSLADRLRLECRPRVRDGEADSAEIWVNGKPVTEALRTEEIGERASRLAPERRVRAALLALQRRARQAPGLVADGRDMGTVVFPDALAKVFLTASAEVRAQRRYKQLKDKGFDVSLARLLKVIRERDVRDSTRSASPLVAAADAERLDTSELTIAEVVSRVLDLVNQKLAVARTNQR